MLTCTQMFSPPKGDWTEYEPCRTDFTDTVFPLLKDALIADLHAALTVCSDHFFTLLVAALFCTSESMNIVLTIP